MNKYEKIYEQSKASGGLYHIGYKKIVLSFWLFISAVVAFWISKKFALLFLVSAIIFWVWALIEKRFAFNKKYSDEKYKNIEKEN